MSAEHIPDDLRGLATGQSILEAYVNCDVVGQTKLGSSIDVALGIYHVRGLIAQCANCQNQHILVGDRIMVAISAVATANDQVHAVSIVDSGTVLRYIAEVNALVCVPELRIGLAGESLNEEQSSLPTGYTVFEQEVFAVALEHAESCEVMSCFSVVSLICCARRDHCHAEYHQRSKNESKKLFHVSHFGVLL